MKKNFAIIGMIAVCLASVSCVKQLETDTVLPAEQDGIQVTLNVNDAAWDACKSAYAPGTGIAVDHNEKIGLFYANGTMITGGPVSGQSYASPATPSGAGKYTFTAPEESVDSTWYAIVPYSLNLTRCQLNGKQLMLMLPSTQYPGQNTFDPATDLLVGKPFKLTESGNGKTATIDAFKRLTAPLKLQLTGLGASDKVYAVTFALSQTAANSNQMIGYRYYSVGENPEDFAFTGMQTAGTRQNGVSAIYDKGLVAEGGNWPVWFNVWPFTVNANCNATVTVFTADSCYTRTAPLPAGSFVSDKINVISFNVKGENYTAAAAISQGFFAPGVGTTKAEASVSLTATDGVARTWNFKGLKWTASVDDGGSTLPDALAFPSHTSSNDSYLEIPSVGKKITKIRLYFAPLSHFESRDYNLQVCNGSEVLADHTSITTMPLGTKGCKAGGYYDIELPDGCDDMTGLTLKFGICAKNVKAIISRMALFLGDPAVDKNDYLALFEAGEDIVIGNQTYNINDEGIAYAILEDEPTYNQFKAAVTGKDIVFIDNNVTINGDNSSGIVLKRERPTAIVGRYKKGMGQPFIDMKGKFFQINGGGVSLLNVRMKSTDASHGMFLNNYAENPMAMSVCVIDCTIDYSQCFCLDYDVSYGGACVANFIVDNSIVTINSNTNKASFFLTNASTDFNNSALYRKMSVTNTVFYCPNTGSSNSSFRMLVKSNMSDFSGTATEPASAQLNCSNLAVTFSNNTIYNLAPRYVMSAGYTKSINMNDNVIYGTYHGSNSDAHMCLVRCYGGNIGTAYGVTWSHPKAANSSLTGNRVEFGTALSTSDNPDWVPAMHGSDVLDINNNPYYTISGNTCTLGVSAPTLFGTINEAKRYFPVNGEGGATYDTKLWQKWN